MRECSDRIGVFFKMFLRFIIIIHVVSCVFSAENYRNIKSSIESSKNADGNCDFDSLAVYKVTLEGHWSRENFPKHYPETRPPAHFSKTFGLTHNSNFTLFQLGDMASVELKEFCKTSKSEEWENIEHNEDEIFDEFIIPKLENPNDKVEARLFVQSNYSLISIVTKLMPSPDWFIGISSLQLCRNNKWVERMSLEAMPYDCGVSSGLTFSAPFWATTPQESITKITAKHPNHGASSFYYPERERLPVIAYYRLHKIKEYVGVKEKSVKRIHQKYRRHDERHHSSRRRTNHNRVDVETKTVTKAPQSEDAIAPRKHFSDYHYESIDCIVSEWNEWTECSKKCGLGEKFRNRTIVKLPQIKKGGQPCPQLTERSWCGSSRCKPSLINENISNSSYFKW